MKWVGPANILMPNSVRELQEMRLVDNIVKCRRIVWDKPVMETSLRHRRRSRWTHHTLGAESALGNPFVKQLDSPGGQISHPHPTDTRNDVVVN